MNLMAEYGISNLPSGALEALDLLEERFATDPSVGAITIDRVLRVVTGKRALFKGKLDGADVVFRLALDRQERKSIGREWIEANRVYDLFPDPPFNVARPIYFNKDISIMVLGYVEGTPLLEYMWSLPVEARVAKVVQSSLWLRQYMRPAEKMAQSDARLWYRRAAKAAQKQPHSVLRKIDERVLRRMKRLARRLDGTQWRVSNGHGDFHPNNLILSENALTGIDLGGTRHTPIYNDMGRYLTHMARHRIELSGEKYYGVDRGSFDAFVDNFDLNALESEAFLPLMIAFNCLNRVESPNLSDRRVKRAVEMSESLFEDLRKIT